MEDTRYSEEQLSTSPTATRTVLASEPLSNVRRNFGRRRLSRGTLLLLWGLRVYVLLMVLLIALQIWNTLHVGG